MQQSVNQEERAFLAWNVLCQCAIAKRLITYKELGERVGVHHRTAKFFLELIQNYCLQEKLPPLTILVVNQTRLPGGGFIAWDIDNFDRGVEYVYQYNWLSIQNPFEYAKQGRTSKGLIEELLEISNNSEDIYAKIKVRSIAQDIFRKALLYTYESKCAICGFSMIEVLEASHIIPWVECTKSEKLDIKNGILLCNNHHKLFDKGVITIDNNYRVHYSEKFKKENQDYIFIKEELGVDNMLIRLPKDKKYWPNKSFIEKHNLIYKENR